MANALFEAPDQHSGQKVWDVAATYESLAQVVALWGRCGAPPTAIYETLAGIVLPDARPVEVFLYPHQIQPGRRRSQLSVGRLLAKAAVCAKSTRSRA